MRSFPDLVVDDVAASAAFYRSLFGLAVIADQGWYAELGDDDANVLIAFVERGHPTVPGAGASATGVLVSFELADVAAVARAPASSIAASSSSSCARRDSR